MSPWLQNLRLRLMRAGLWPSSRLAHLAWYLLAVDVLLALLQAIGSRLHIALAESLGGWVAFLSFAAAFLFLILSYRWLKIKLLWRLRNRLIVTYVFFGLIPTLLLIAMAGVMLYLFSGQFANFVVTSELNTHLRSLEAANGAIANELAARLERSQPPTAESLQGLRERDPAWQHRQVCAWLNGKPLPLCGDPPPFSLPAAAWTDAGKLVRDGDHVYLRVAASVPVRSQPLLVITSEAFDHKLAEAIAANLGEIALYDSALLLDSDKPAPSERSSAAPDQAAHSADNAGGAPPTIAIAPGKEGVAVRANRQDVTPDFVAGALSPPTSGLDKEITFGTPLAAMNWKTGKDYNAGALLRVRTRPSILYARLFAALGDFAKGVEYILLFVAILFAVIELVALVVGTRLTRTITRAIAQLYTATQHINRGDFSHRIPVTSHDQLASLANSFNSMTTSLEQLILEQKEKQRLENELVIAQEVQAQLFPRQVSQLESLEVHGFCRPARTVSGDYYDFLALRSDKLILAVGDVSGKGISAALLMATIHSAVRAYSLEGIPLLREPAVVGVGAGESRMLSSSLPGIEVSPAALLGLLNHQLYDSTPTEKYATLFLGIYDSLERMLTYSNGGHLPPILICDDGSTRRLDCGGTVVGLFDKMAYDQTSVRLQSGEIFLAFSDGVTEPENDFGEFGEQRLIEVVRENRHLPLARISEIVTAAVDDWIGDKEQPDDVTLVLARAR
jgi:sigma-B regulation protein RsbU (phosphoserine phosphatase)